MKDIDKTNISPEEWAKEIIDLRNSTDGMDDYLPKDYNLALKLNKSRLQKSLDIISRDLEKGISPNPKLLADVLTCVSKFLVDTAKYGDDKEMLITSLKFYKLAKSVFNVSHGRDFETFLAGQKIGLFVLGLTFAGSSAKQAKYSVAEWTNLSKTKIENHYTKSEKDYSSLEELFLFNSIEIAQMFIEYKNNPFPKGIGSVKKTHQSFLDMKKSLVQYMRSSDYEPFMSLKPLHLRINWKEIEQIHQELVSIDC